MVDFYDRGSIWVWVSNCFFLNTKPNIDILEEFVRQVTIISQIKDPIVHKDKQGMPCPSHNPMWCSWKSICHGVKEHSGFTPVEDAAFVVTTRRMLFNSHEEC